MRLCFSSGTKPGIKNQPVRSMFNSTTGVWAELESGLVFFKLRSVNGDGAMSEWQNL
jgi:hypothetical protein